LKSDVKLEKERGREREGKGERVEQSDVPPPPALFLDLFSGLEGEKAKLSPVPEDLLLPPKLAHFTVSCSASHPCAARMNRAPKTTPAVVGNQPLVEASLSFPPRLRPAFSPSWMRSNETASMTPHAAAAAKPLNLSGRGLAKKR